MKIVKVKGIIISDTNYSESSKILNVLTEEYGKISVVSKGCRNLRSKLRIVSNKFIYGYFNIYYKEKSLSTLISVDVIDDFKNVLNSLEKVSYLSYTTELVRQVIEQDYNNSIFDIYISYILKLNNNYDSQILTNIVELKLLDFLGVKPEFDCCSICSNQNNIVTICSNNYGYICNNCYTNEFIYNEKTIKLIRLLYYVDINSIDNISVKEDIKKEINMFIEEYYEKNTGLYIKSKKFLKEIID